MSSSKNFLDVFWIKWDKWVSLIPEWFVILNSTVCICARIMMIKIHVFWNLPVWNFRAIMILYSITRVSVLKIVKGVYMIESNFVDSVCILWDFIQITAVLLIQNFGLNHFIFEFLNEIFKWWLYNSLALVFTI